MARKKSPDEGTFGGFARPNYNMLVARVNGVDSQNRTIDISWMRKTGGRTNVSIWGDSGDYTLPAPGDLVMCVVDETDEVYVVGYRDIAFPDRLEANEIPQASLGEKLVYSRAYKQRLWFQDNGRIELMTKEGEGLEIEPTRRVRFQAPSLFEVITMAGKMAYGTVRRLRPPFVTPDEDQAIPDLATLSLAAAGGGIAREFNVDVSYITTGPPFSALGRAARFVMGTGVYNDFGIPEGPLTGRTGLSGNLRAVLEVMAVPTIGGFSLASLEIDEIGNLRLSSLFEMKMQALLMEMMAVQVNVKALQVNLGLLPIDKALLANLFLLFYNTHVHVVPQTPAGATVSTPPIPTAPSAAVASQSVSVSI